MVLLVTSSGQLESSVDCSYLVLLCGVGVAIRNSGMAPASESAASVFVSQDTLLLGARA